MGVTRVKITKDGSEAYVIESAVDAWVRHGWTREDDVSNEETPVEPETQEPAVELETTEPAVEATEGEAP